MEGSKLEMSCFLPLEHGRLRRKRCWGRTFRPAAGTRSESRWVPVAPEPERRPQRGGGLVPACPREPRAEAASPAQPGLRVVDRRVAGVASREQT